MQSILRGSRRSLNVGRLSNAQRDWLIVGAALLVAAVAGTSVAQGGTRGSIAIALGVLALGGTIIGALVRSRLRSDFAAIELPVLFVLMAELVFRQRDAGSLASNPLDAAGLYRVACIGLALLFGALALTSPITRAAEHISTRPYRLYCAYVLVVFVGAPLSVNLPLTAYRGVELAIGVIALAGAYRRGGREAMDRILLLLYWFTAVSVILVWIEAAAMPGTAFTSVANSPFPIQLHGVFPAVSANGTGTIGAVLGLWSLARLLSPVDRGAASIRTLRALAALGFITQIFAQYRTGYVISVLCVLLLLTMRARAAAFWVVLVGVFVAITWGGQIAHQATPVLERGANLDTIRSLSGRLTYWSTAVPVWKESPIFGRGLLTASRYEVLAKLGSVYTSSIHGTWVEALVGTGIVGVALLGFSVLITTFRTLAMAMRPAGRIVPFLLMAILLVRSLTGPTFEIAGGASVMLMTLALIARDPPRLAGRRTPSRLTAGGT